MLERYFERSRGYDKGGVGKSRVWVWGLLQCILWALGFRDVDEVNVDDMR